MPEELLFETVRTLVRRHLGMSRTLMRRLKAQDAIMVNGAVTGLKTPLSPGDVVELELQEDDESNIAAENVPLDIAFEDDALIVINKPAGMVVHPVQGYQSGTLANAVAYHMKAIGLSGRVRPVHRLDKDTSGLVVFAKHAYAHHQLGHQLDTGRMRRRYVALAAGWMGQDSGMIQAPIRRDENHPVRREVAPMAAGQRAVTHFQVLHRWKDATAVLLWLETGRTHQIRVHLAHIGHPLFGDDLYGGDEKYIDRQALHAFRLAIRHPISGERLSWTADMPADMKACVESLNTTGDEAWSGDISKVMHIFDDV